MVIGKLYLLGIGLWGERKRIVLIFVGYRKKLSISKEFFVNCSILYLEIVKFRYKCFVWIFNYVLFLFYDFLFITFFYSYEIFNYFTNI